MAGYGFGLCIFYILVKTGVRYWLFRPVPGRPAPLRNNEMLRLLDLAAMLALIGAFFMLAAQIKLIKAIVVATGLIVYDMVIRWCFLEIEIRRLQAKSAKWSHRGAMRHVRRRAESPMFH